MVGAMDGLVPLLVAARYATRLTTSDRGGMLVAVKLPTRLQEFHSLDGPPV